MRIRLGGLGILSGNEKRLLENCIDSRLFTQRKSYDEYYVDVQYWDVKKDLGIDDLMILAELFHVIVTEGSVKIEQKY